MSIRPSRLFIVWSPYARRAALLAPALNAHLVFVGDLLPRGSPWRKPLIWLDYLYKTFLTVRLLLRVHPQTVFVQAPPSPCIVLCWFCSRLFRHRLVIDAHNASFERHWFYFPFYRTALRDADLVLVHNDELCSALRQRDPKMRFFTLSDRIPAPSSDRAPKPYLLVVASFSEDEPLAEIFEGVRLYLSRELHPAISCFKVTGNYRKLPALHGQYEKCAGLEFLGFVDLATYEDLLASAFGVIAMSTWEMVQQCACIEAVGAGVPLLTSSSETNRRMFGAGAVLRPPRRAEIAAGISEFCSRRTELADRMRQVRENLNNEWERQFLALRETLRETESHGKSGT